MENKTMATIQTITPKMLDALRLSGKTVKLIDVRTPAEFREVHADLARNVPLDSLDLQAEMETRNSSHYEPLYITCRSGSRAKKACEAFISAGYADVVNVEGGTQAWEQAGLPLVRGKKTISLERQVRIVAGLLVLIGVVLGVLVSPGFVGISAFVGAGLVFAGITDNCGMAMMLAKMPWNQVKEEAAVCCLS